MRFFKTVIILILFIAVTGCATYPHRLALNRMKLGMNRFEVAELLGEPENRRTLDNFIVLKYYLADDAAVCTAHYLVFNRKNKLVDWWEDKKDEILDRNDILLHMLGP